MAERPGRARGSRGGEGHGELESVGKHTQMLLLNLCSDEAALC